MSKNLGAVVAAIGLLVALVSAAADTLGIGDEGGSFGTNQVVGIVAGGVVFLIGLWMFFNGPTSGQKS